MRAQFKNGIVEGKYVDVPEFPKELQVGVKNGQVAHCVDADNFDPRIFKDDDVIVHYTRLGSTTSFYMTALALSDDIEVKLVEHT